MRRKILLVAALIFSGALLLPTVASSLAGAGDRIHEDVVLESHSGPNGAYAVMSENDELELNFGPSNPNVPGDGVNPDAVTPFDRVFNITYTGQQRAEVWLTSTVDGVSFYRGTDATASIEGRSNNITLGPGQTLEVSVLIDTTDGTVPSGDTFTVNARLDESTGTETTGDGETTDVQNTDVENTDVENTDDADEETTDGGFRIQGQNGGDDDTTPTPTPTTDEDATTDGTSSGGGGGAPGDRPVFEVTSASVSTGSAAPGESVTVDATVANVGSADGAASVRLFANDSVVGTQEVTVPAGDARPVTFTTSFDTVGAYDLRVENVAAGTVLVQSQQVTTEETATAAASQTTVAPVTSPDLAEEPSPTPSESGGFPWLVVWLAMFIMAAVVTGYWTVQYSGG